MKNYLDAAAGKNTGKIPVWFMRQAGRYLPEYQELRKKHDFRTMSHTPELICETTLQPLRRYNVDAAILFSDILTCLEYMGAPFKFEESGPKLSDHGPRALTSLKALNPAEDMKFVGDGIKLICQHLNQSHSSKPLIGFVGAPFTLASYLVEGGTSREFFETRKMMFSHKKEFMAALDLLAESVSNYLIYQVQCGVKAVQVFDSWVGTLSLEQYREFIFPSVKKIVTNFKQNPLCKNVPLTLYSQPTTHLLPALVATGADVISVDWRQEISTVAEQLDQSVSNYFEDMPSKSISIQGNLDPLITTLPWREAERHVLKLLASAREAKILDRWIFNVGHGVNPETKTDTIEAIINLVHESK
jgi:uroporphyrinogen decarboxylase